MKILFVGDYSGYHASLAAELRRRGHDVTVVSDGNKYMDTARDVSLDRKPGFIGSLKYLYQACNVMAGMRGFDVVQLINAHFLDLRPGKLSYLLKMLKNNNGLVCLSHCSTDYYFAKAMTEGRVLEYSEYGVEGKPTDFTINCERNIDLWLMPVCKAWADQVYADVDGAVSALYEYHKVWEEQFAGRMDYVGIGVDTRALAYEPLPDHGPLRVMIGIKPETAYSKGIYILQKALQKVADRHPGEIELVEARQLPLRDYLQLMRSCHVVADQLYSYTPSTNALQAMAMGKVVLSGGEEEHYKFIGEEVLRPIINADPRTENLAEWLEPLLLDRADLQRRSLQGRKLVEKHNDIRVVADRLLEAWQHLKEQKK